MKRNHAKEAAGQTIREYRILKPSLDDLIFILEDKGYELIDYSRNGENPILQNLGLHNSAAEGYAFTYTSGDMRYVFLEEGLSVEEKAYALAHELGHIVFGHTSEQKRTFDQEWKANEFAHYLIHPPVFSRMYSWTHNHKVIAAIILVAILAGGASVPTKSYVDARIYHDYYYVTDSGTHYHVEDCYYLQGHDYHRMTKEEFASGEYTACKICIR